MHGHEKQDDLTFLLSWKYCLGPIIEQNLQSNNPDCKLAQPPYMLFPRHIEDNYD